MKDITHIAAEIAKGAHDGQYRMGVEKRPYIVHPALAADLVEKLVTNDKILIAATWLHDAIEDTPLKSKEDFEKAFQEHGYSDAPSIRKVYGLVKELSMPDGIEWKRIRSFQVDKIAEMTAGAKVLKMADQVANTFDVVLYPPTEWPATKIRNYFFKAIDICVACSEAAPKLYNLFYEVYQRRENLSKNDIAGLIQKFSHENKAEEDRFSAAKPSSQETFSLSEEIKLLISNGTASGAHIDISKDRDIADSFREYIERSGTFARTHPLRDKKIRELSFAKPVDVEFCKGFCLEYKSYSQG